MIETIIEGLEMRGVDNIVIVTGYLADQFAYLQRKYDNVRLVKNEVFETVNNISSVYAAKKYLLDGSCFICEADLYVADKSIFLSKLTNSCYFGKPVKGFCDDWVFDTNREVYITSIGKQGTGCHCMCGLSYFSAEDTKKLHAVITYEYDRLGYEPLFWDEVLDWHLENFKLTINPVMANQIVEIGTVEDYERISIALSNESMI